MRLLLEILVMGWTEIETEILDVGISRRSCLHAGPLVQLKGIVM